MHTPSLPLLLSANGRGALSGQHPSPAPPARARRVVSVACCPLPANCRGPSDQQSTAQPLLSRKTDLWSHVAVPCTM